MLSQIVATSEVIEYAHRNKKAFVKMVRARCELVFHEGPCRMHSEVCKRSGKPTHPFEFVFCLVGAFRKKRSLLQ